MWFLKYLIIYIYIKCVCLWLSVCIYIYLYVCMYVCMYVCTCIYLCLEVSNQEQGYMMYILGESTGIFGGNLQHHSTSMIVTGSHLPCGCLRAGEECGRQPATGRFYDFTKTGRSPSKMRNQTLRRVGIYQPTL